MRAITLLIGAHNLKHSAVPRSILRLASEAAARAVTSRARVILLGDAPTVLAVGTAVMGLESSRTVEGGQRPPSPLIVLPLLSSGNEALDRSMKVDPPRGGSTDDLEHQDTEERSRSGGLSLLVDLGIMDVAEGPKASLEVTDHNRIVEALDGVLLEYLPREILTFGILPRAIFEAASTYACKRETPFTVVPGWNDEQQHPKGVETLQYKPAPPMLGGMELRFRHQDDGEDDGGGEFHYIDDKEAMREAEIAMWEATMTFQLLVRLGGEDEQN
jgi:hypothetical protein